MPAVEKQKGGEHHMEIKITRPEGIDASAPTWWIFF
jgi:hypothetical protein